MNKALKILTIAWRDFTTKRVMASASRLTYSTLLATVPILAVVFAIARGFGYSIYIEHWFRSLLQAQPDACETVIGFVNSYLLHTKKGMFLGIGLLFMLWTVLMLISNIEQTFNDIWQVRRQRSLFRTFTDYIAMLFTMPIFIVVSSGLSIWVTAINRHLTELALIGPLMKFGIELTPYLLTSGIFVALYVFMPNTNVKLRSALIPGIAAGICFQLFQVLYINSQIWISSYNAIYGSFAVLPFFMLWMQISWTICLVGAEMSYMVQNREEFTTFTSSEPLSQNARVEISSRIMDVINEQFNNGGIAFTAIEIKERTGISMRLLQTLLYDLQRIHFIAEITYGDKGVEPRYQPAEALRNLTAEELKRRLDALGYYPDF